MKSGIYEGQVRHLRTEPVLHEFSYRMFMMYLDLGELPTLFDRYRGWSGNRPALAWFNRADHLGSSDVPLDQAVRDLVLEQTGRQPAGPVRLLTHLRYFGHCFNPVSFYYCFDEEDTRVETVVAEVNNTPWGEQHCYVLPRDADQSKLRFRPAKEFHVSPFMPMEIDYDWQFTSPESTVGVLMASSVGGRRMFHASLVLERTEISRASLRRVLVKFPFITIKVVAAIYWQAFRLWLKRCTFHTHPERQKRVVS